MAIPPFAQMLFGRPKLTIGFEESLEETGKVLLSFVKNETIKSSLLRRIKVEREPANILVFFTIVEQGTNKIVVNNIRGWLTAHSGASGLGVQAAPPFPIPFTLILFDKDRAYIRDVQNKKLIPISDGEYDATVTVVYNDHSLETSREFRLRQDPLQTFWYRR